MVFALQGFTKEFIALHIDGIGVNYTGWILGVPLSSYNLQLREKKSTRI